MRENGAARHEETKRRTPSRIITRVLFFAADSLFRASLCSLLHQQTITTLIHVNGGNASSTLGSGVSVSAISSARLFKHFYILFSFSSLFRSLFSLHYFVRFFVCINVLLLSSFSFARTAYAQTIIPGGFVLVEVSTPPSLFRGERERAAGAHIGQCSA